MTHITNIYELNGLIHAHIHAETSGNLEADIIVDYKKHEVIFCSNPHISHGNLCRSLLKICDNVSLYGVKDMPKKDSYIWC